MTKIYLVENCYGDSNKVYIGKTKNSRYSSHKKKFGKNITYTIIDEVNTLNSKNWKPLESFWIEQFKQWGFILMNKNKGGGGCSFHSEFIKKTMRKPKLNKENYSYPKTKAWKDSIKGTTKNHPLSRNQSISNSMKGYKQTKEHIKKRVDVLKGKPNTKNQKPKPKGFGEKISKSLKGIKKPTISKPILQFNMDGIFIREWESITEACSIGLGDKSKNPNITKCCKGKIKKAYGYIWKYKI